MDAVGHRLQGGCRCGAVEIAIGPVDPVEAGHQSVGADERRELGFRCHAVTLRSAGTRRQVAGTALSVAVGTARRCPGATLPSMEERYESELARSAAVLDGVDRALELLSEGTYGQCDTCGAPVLDADLEQDPTRRSCEQHLVTG